MWDVNISCCYATRKYITSLCSPLPLFIPCHTFLLKHPPRANRSEQQGSSFCICFPFITAEASWGVGSFLLRDPEISGEIQRPAYLPQSGNEGEPSALPSWGLALKTDEKPNVRSELPVGLFEAPMQWKKKRRGGWSHPWEWIPDLEVDLEGLNFPPGV